MLLSKRSQRRKSLILVLGITFFVAACNPEDESDAPHVMDVKVPALSPTAFAGQRLYLNSCASCHGVSTDGTKQGPPLVMYDQVHHPDGRFYDAVKKGVKQHHWSFGDMPPIPGVSEDDIALIIAYVREIQAADEKRYRDGME